MRLAWRRGQPRKAAFEMTDSPIRLEATDGAVRVSVLSPWPGHMSGPEPPAQRGLDTGTRRTHARPGHPGLNLRVHCGQLLNSFRRPCHLRDRLADDRGAAELPVGADAPAVWQWLARRPFITNGPLWRSRDLARDVLDAEFRRRVPKQYGSYERHLMPTINHNTSRFISLSDRASPQDRCLYTDPWLVVLGLTLASCLSSRVRPVLLEVVGLGSTWAGATPTCRPPRRRPGRPMLWTRLNPHRTAAMMGML